MTLDFLHNLIYREEFARINSRRAPEAFMSIWGAQPNFDNKITMRNKLCGESYMKILNIMLSRGLGGIEQAFLDYSSNLEAQGFKVINITSIFAKINAVLKSKTIKLLNL